MNSSTIYEYQPPDNTTHPYVRRPFLSKRFLYSVGYIFFGLMQTSYHVRLYALKEKKDVCYRECKDNFGASLG